MLLSGRSSYTFFLMECAEWQEFQQTVETSILSYDFRIRQPGSIRSFPVFFGVNVRSDPCLFPVGLMDMDFALDVVIHIADRLGDIYKFKARVKVRVSSIL